MRLKLSEILLYVQMFSPNTIEDQSKKRSSPKFEGVLSPNSIENQKKKGLHRSFLLYSAGIWDLLVLTATFSSNHPVAYSLWRALNSR